MGSNAIATMLPDLAMLRVLEYLPASDIVSVGQVCRRWRELASREEVWWHRELDAAFDEADDGRHVARVARFAPCLRALSVAATSWSSAQRAARTAVKHALLEATTCKVRRLRDVWCHVDATWATSLLSVHAEHVRKVSARYVDAGVLHTLHGMARHGALRALQVWHCDAALRLCGLALPEHGLDQAGLRWLDVFDLPKDTTLSLLRAHRHTLREVILHVGTTAPPRGGGGWRALRGDAEDDGWPDTCSSLHLQLSACGLDALRALLLDRYGRAHPQRDCAAQLADLRDALPSVTVGCRQCEEEKANEENKKLES